MLRRALAGWLVVLALAAAWFANLALWVRADVLDAETFSGETASLLEDKVLRALLVDRLGDEVLAAVPELAPFEPLVRQAVDQAVGSPQFEVILSDTIASAHRALFSGSEEAVTLDLSQARPLVTDAVATVAPEAVPLIPGDEVFGTVVLVSADDVPSVADQADWVRSLAPLVGGLALALALLAVLISPRRPSTIRFLGFGLVAMALLGWGTVWLVEDVLLGRISDPDSRGVAEHIVDVATDSFVRRTVLLGLLGLAIAASGFVLSGLLRSLQTTPGHGTPTGGWGPVSSAGRGTAPTRPVAPAPRAQSPLAGRGGWVDARDADGTYR